MGDDAHYQACKFQLAIQKIQLCQRSQKDLILLVYDEKAQNDINTKDKLCQGRLIALLGFEDVDLM